MKRLEGKTKHLRDLIGICHFTEGLSTRIHGLLDENEIYRAIRGKFGQSKRYGAAILLLTNDGSKLRIAEKSISPGRVKVAEKASGLRVKDYEIDLRRSNFYSQAIREGKTVLANVDDILGELFPQPMASLLSKTMSYENWRAILTPLKRHGKVIGALAISSTDLAAHLVPPVRNLAQHISSALELSAENMERRQVETQLRRSEEKYRQLVENLNEGVWIIDKKAYTTFVNPRMAEMLGYTVDEMLGKHLFSFMDEYGVEIATRNLERHKQGIREQYGFEFLKKDGTQVYMLLEASPITDDKGNYTGTIVGVQDITERRRMEEALQESERHYRLLADNVTDIIWTMDMNLRYTYVSPSVTRLSGYSVEEATGQTLQEVLTPASFEVAIKAFAEEKVLESMEEKDLTRSRMLELELNRKDGSTFWAEVTMTALRDQDGQPVGFVGVARDITERKQVEELKKSGNNKEV